MWRTALDGLLAGSASTGLEILIPESAPGRALLDTLGAEAGTRVRPLPGSGQFAAALGEALASAGQDRDLVVLARPVRLPADWLVRLGLAALSDDTVAAASPLIAGGPAQMFAGYEEVPLVGPTERPVTAVPALRPRIAQLSPYCAYLRRSALELLGASDQALPGPAAVLDDLAARALAVGLSCALADDVLAQPLDDPAGEPDQRGPGDRAQPAAPPGPAALAQRELARADAGVLRHALLGARTRRSGLSVTIDARGLGAGFGGTQTYTAALVRALAASDRVTVRAVVGETAAAEALRASLAEGEDRVEIITYDQAVAGVVRSDVVHRPQQVFSPDDLALLRDLGERLVVSQLDLIAYRSPSYHAGWPEWQAYRRIARLSLGLADWVIFLSGHARRDAIAEELVSAGRSAVVGIGVDAPGPGHEARRPARLEGDTPLLVMLGADYGHKNRPFALRILGQLRRRGWDGRLVLAGAHVAHGSSAAAEAEVYRSDPALAEHVIDLGPVDAAEKTWLLSRAAALLCPSTYEGFGLTPLEAIAGGVPCAYPNLTSLGEILGAEAATIVPWDASASAERVLALLRPGAERDSHLARLGLVLERFAWEPMVDGLLGVYQAAVSAPFRSAAPRKWEELGREEFIVALDHQLRDLHARVSFGLPLVDRGGLLTRAQQQGLMRVASRAWLRGPLLGPLEWIGRLGAGEPD